MEMNEWLGWKGQRKGGLGLDLKSTVDIGFGV